MAPPQLPANTGDAHATPPPPPPPVPHFADMIYGCMSPGGRWSERKTPLDVQIKGFRRASFIFSDVFRLLSFRVDSKINMYKPTVIPQN